MPCNDCKDGIPRYTHTLTVEKPKTATVDAGNQMDLTDDYNWETVGRIAARFITKGGTESYVFKQTQAATTTVIMCQATSISRSLLENWRLRFGSRKIEIVASYLINETGRVVQIEGKEAK